MTMRCEVLLFAQLRESIGENQIAIELADNATVRDALEALAALHEPIASMQGRLAIAVDQKYQSMSARLRDGCTIALIPPVSGG
jgi:molybdopterin converting factor subunit 1